MIKLDAVERAQFNAVKNLFALLDTCKQRGHLILHKGELLGDELVIIENEQEVSACLYSEGLGYRCYSQVFSKQVDDNGNAIYSHEKGFSVKDFAKEFTVVPKQSYVTGYDLMKGNKNASKILG